ncbi:hypothetical protein SB775_32485, partial [Peribacillus sp. SIMBA_075]
WWPQGSAPSPCSAHGSPCESFYTERLEAQGLQVLVPPPDVQAELDGIIYSELVRGVVTEPSREAYRHAMADLVRDGATGVI